MMPDMGLGSFHPADSEHPAGKERAHVSDNAVRPTQQQQSPPGDKRRGSKGSGHGKWMTLCI